MSSSSLPKVISRSLTYILPGGSHFVKIGTVRGAKKGVQWQTACHIRAVGMTDRLQVEFSGCAEWEPRPVFAEQWGLQGWKSLDIRTGSTGSLRNLRAARFSTWQLVKWKLLLRLPATPECKQRQEECRRLAVAASQNNHQLTFSRVGYFVSHFFSPVHLGCSSLSCPVHCVWFGHSFPSEADKTTSENCSPQSAHTISLLLITDRKWAPMKTRPAWMPRPRKDFSGPKSSGSNWTQFFPHFYALSLIRG